MARALGMSQQRVSQLLKEEVIIDMVIIMPDNFLGSIPPAERQQLYISYL